MCKVNRREFLVGSTAFLSAAAEEELLHGAVPAGAAQAADVDKLAPDIYFHEGDVTSDNAVCNNGWIIFEDYVLVIDANFPAGARLMISKIRAITDKPIRFAFDTHHHGDHAYGNQVFVENGGVPVAHTGVLEEMRRFETGYYGNKPGNWEDASKNRTDLRDTRLKPPSVLFPKELYFDDGKHRVELMHLGVAHTHGDALAWLPNEKILFTGDVCVNGPYNYVGDGDVGKWIATLEAAKKLGARIVGTGHGPRSVNTVLDDQQAFFKALQDQVGSRMADAAPDQAKAQIEAIRTALKANAQIAKYVSDKGAYDGNKSKAISFAAYRATVDLIPADKATVFDPLMAALGYDPNDQSTDVTTPSGIGNVACKAVLTFRHGDGSNQLGNLTASAVPYADYTHYEPVNPPTTVPVNPATVAAINRWQPLEYIDGTGKFVTQSFVGAQWTQVIPFSMTSANEFRSFIALFGPARFGSAEFLKQAQELITLSASLTDRQKMIAEYWANGPHTELPPGHWDLFAQFISNRDEHNIDQDVKMFFALTNAIFDAGIAAWDTKRSSDSVRPATAIPYLFQGQQIKAWGGPYQGTVTEDGSQWIPYQPSSFPTPPFPEYVSGHSAFSAAGAEVLRRFTHSDYFGASVTFPAGSSTIEPGATPAKDVTLFWETFTDAANEAGMSRRYGGIHFEPGDLVGRATGRLVAIQAWKKAKSYINGIEDRRGQGQQ